MSSGFSYIARDPSGADVFKHFLSLAGPARQTRLGSFVVSNGDTAAVVTGVGFAPEWVLIFDDQCTSYGQFIDSGIMGLGMAAGANQWCGRTIMGDLSGYKDSAWYDNFIINNLTEADFVSFDADGFTLNVSASPPATQLFTYICGRGEGNYAVGTDLSPAASGTQSIVCGFEPTAIVVASTMVQALGDEPVNSMMCLGAGDLTHGQWNVWAGDSGGDVYNNQAEQPDRVITFWQDATPASPYQPAVYAEAELVSFDPGGGGGFTLDWTVVDGVQRYYSWFAIDGPAEVNRWTYNHGDFDTGFVPTDERPRGLIFFNNEMGVEGSWGEGTSGSLSIGLGACDPDFNQAVTTYMGIDAPSFFVPRSVREMISGYAFGCYGRRIGGTGTPNTPQNEGALFKFGSPFVPQIYRRVVDLRT